jgi:hypothetical protein
MLLAFLATCILRPTQGTGAEVPEYLTSLQLCESSSSST